MKISQVCKGSRVKFPSWTGEHVYMRRFMRGEPLPADLIRWQPTVNQMLRGIVSSGPVYLMVDQAEVEGGKLQRRPGVHVDGYWNEGALCHGGGGGSPGHGFPSRPGHSHPSPVPGHRHPGQGGHSFPGPETPGHRSVPPGHALASGSREALIIASDVLGCVGLAGRYVGDPAEGGDCSHLDLKDLRRVALEPGRAWFGETGLMLHESIPVERDCLRTVVRLNVTGWGA